jgi:hypothetical protein
MFNDVIVLHDSKTLYPVGFITQLSKVLLSNFSQCQKADVANSISPDNPLIYSKLEHSLNAQYPNLVKLELAVTVFKEEHLSNVSHTS